MTMPGTPFPPLPAGVPPLTPQQLEEILKAVDTSDHPVACRCRPCRNENRIDAGRRSENWALYVGTAQAVFAGVTEALVRAGMRFGTGEVDTGMPWVNLTILFVLVLPKTVGRLQAAKVIDAITSRNGNGRNGA